jgi:uroporphyrinogen decarboxylase
MPLGRNLCVNECPKIKGRMEMCLEDGTGLGLTRKMRSAATPRGRVLAQIQHQATAYVPYTIRFEGDVAERLDAHYGGDAWRSLVDNAIRRLPAPELEPQRTGARTYTDPYGSVWQVDHRMFHLVEPALKVPSLEGFAFPDLELIFNPVWEAKVSQAIEEQRDHFLVIGFGTGLFERSWGLRGFENAMMDMVAQIDFYKELIERLTEHQEAILARLLDLPVDGILFADDWGYQQGVLVGAERWRRIFKPRYSRLYRLVHQAGKVALTHCCGSIEEILPDLIEIGLDVYQSVQPEAKNNNPYELKRKYGDQLTFWGGLGSQSTIPFGTPDEIRAEVNHLCREMGRGGGYILCPAKALQPETPTENAAAVVEAFLEQAGVRLG